MARKDAGEWEGETFRYRGVRKDGGVIWLERRGRKVYDPQTGALQYIVTVTRDISDQVRHEQENRCRQRAAGKGQIAAEAASVAKSQFLATMSHANSTRRSTGVMGGCSISPRLGPVRANRRATCLARPRVRPKAWF